MKATIIPAGSTATTREHARSLDRLARAGVLARLRHLREGEIVLVERGRTSTFGTVTDEFPVRCVIHVDDPRFFSDVAFGGTVGAGEAYTNGFFRCSDLTAAVRILVRNRDVMDSIDSGLARVMLPAYKLFHWLNRNTRAGSRRNIAAHYDLGNDMFALFLDETMMYSAGIFETPEASLHEASVAKLERICRKLELAPTDHVVEIGTGWGGFAIHAARHYGCRVTTTTISREQHELARERIQAAGLQDRITVLLEDYRALEGRFDKLVSIEMIEAIGRRYFDTYFRKCSDLLKPHGMMLLQAITIADQHFEAASRSVDFIQRYIFPGSCIPSVAAMTDSVARVTDMRLFHLEDIGPHYATTLREWRARFMRNADEVLKLGYPQSFLRLWEFYLCYCEGGFMERCIGDVQMLLTKPRCSVAPLLPELQRPRAGAAHG